MLFNSVPGVNKWGPNPKGIGNEVCAPEVIYTDTKPVEAIAEENITTDETEEKTKKEDDNNII